MDRTKITQRFIERDLPKLSANVTKEAWVWDSEVLAFGIRMRPGARPSYAMRWKDDRSRDRKYSIGPVHQIDLDDARAIARQRFGEVAAGQDPIEKAADRKRFTVTVADLIDEVADQMEAKGRSATYIRDFKQQMRDHVKPTLGNRVVRDVTATDVDRLLAKLSNKPALHNRVRAGLSSVFTAALRGRYRPDNPVMGTKPTHEEERTRLLSNTEIDQLLKVLNKHPGQSSDAMRLLWLTGSRPKELFSAKWQDLDLEAGVWDKPAQFVKQKRRHRVTIQATAVAVFKRMKEEAKERSSPVASLRTDPKPTDWVFPSGEAKDGHLTTIKKHHAMIIKETKLTDVRPYDLRKAFITRLVASGNDLKTIMSITGHTQVAVLMKHYAQVMDGKQKAVLESVFGG